MAGLHLAPSGYVLLVCALVCALANLADGAAMMCHSIVPAGLRCRWPEEGLECHCVPNAECSQTTNACRCLPGYTGPDCTQTCPFDVNGKCLTKCDSSPYCYPLESCRQDPSGVCLCKEGYSGKDCNLCDHNVLSNCTLCPYQPCENNGRCDLVTRTCACRDGYQGSYCSLCYPSLHPSGCGEHCDHSCVNSYCDTQTGACSCPHGFDTVANCSFCDPVRVSDGCMRFCHTVCRAGGLCNVEQQRCMCPDGYVGDDCRLCDPRTHPTRCIEHCPSECQNSGYCDVITNTCLCQPGYEVTYNCGLCRPSLHSNACVNHCDPACMNGGDCLSSQGLCMCPLGYIAHDCSLCIPSLHARNCTDHCPLCYNDGTCNTLDRTCTCSAGWQGVSCQDPCPFGTYGVGCQQCDCGKQPCDPQTGACIITTTTPKPTTPQPPTTTTIATTTVLPTTTTVKSTPVETTPKTTLVTTITGPVNLVELVSTQKQVVVVTSAGAGPIRTQQSPAEISSLAPGLILENHQVFSSTYVIAIVCSAIILVILLTVIIFYLIHDRRKRKRQPPEATPEEIPLNNVVTNNLENGRSSNVYVDGILAVLGGDEVVDGTLPDPVCLARQSLTEEQVKRLSRISGDVAFFAKIPNAIAESKNPNVFKENPGSKGKYWEDGGTVKPNNNEADAVCKGSEDADDDEKPLKGAKAPKDAEAAPEDAGGEVNAGALDDEEDAMLGACGGARLRFGPDATSTPRKQPADRDSRIYEEVIIPSRDPTAIRNPRMSGEYYLLEPNSDWGSSKSSGESGDSPKTLRDDKSSLGSGQRRSADSGIEQAAASLGSPHYEQLERPVDFVQPRSPPLSSRTDKKDDDERDSGVYAHLSRGHAAKGYNRLEFSPGQQRKPSSIDIYSENPYGRLNADRTEDDSMSD